MVLINAEGHKAACSQCIRGHRVKDCNHTDRPLESIRRPGRPRKECSCPPLDCTCIPRKRAREQGEPQDTAPSKKRRQMPASTQVSTTVAPPQVSPQTTQAPQPYQGHSDPWMNQYYMDLMQAPSIPMTYPRAQPTQTYQAHDDPWTNQYFIDLMQAPSIPMAYPPAQPNHGQNPLFFQQQSQDFYSQSHLMDNQPLPQSVVHQPPPQSFVGQNQPMAPGVPAPFNFSAWSIGQPPQPAYGNDAPSNLDMSVNLDAFFGSPDQSLPSTFQDTASAPEVPSIPDTLPEPIEQSFPSDPVQATASAPGELATLKALLEPIKQSFLSDPVQGTASAPEELATLKALLEPVKQSLLSDPVQGTASAPEVPSIPETLPEPVEQSTPSEPIQGTASAAVVSEVGNLLQNWPGFTQEVDSPAPSPVEDSESFPLEKRSPSPLYSLFSTELSSPSPEPIQGIASAAAMSETRNSVQNWLHSAPGADNSAPSPVEHSESFPLGDMVVSPLLTISAEPSSPPPEPIPGTAQTPDVPDDDEWMNEYLDFTQCGEVPANWHMMSVPDGI